MKCPQCQREIRDDSRFCIDCGYAVNNRRDHTPNSVTISPTSNRNAAPIHRSVDPLIGQVLGGKYKLDSRLGEGGMGTVYRARRVHIGDEVAVKVLHTKYVAQVEAIARFQREARAAAQLRHPNVVVIYDYGEARELGVLGYIVMELVEGKPLGDILEAEGKLPPARAIALMRHICAGVGAAHKRNIIHRDLKPDNIVVLPAEGDDEETVKVVDFGLAKLRDMLGADTLTVTGTIMGTPYYMSPEQCRGEKLDSRSDVYSLGAILYEMLAGERPFTAPSAAAVIARHLTEPPPRLPNEKEIAPELCAAIQRALSKNVDARQSDATILSREINSGAAAASPSVPVTEPAPAVLLPTQPAVIPAIVTGKNVPLATLTHVGAQAQRLPQPEQQTRSKRSSRAVFLFGAIVVLFTLVGVAGFFIWSQQKKDTASTQTPNANTGGSQNTSGLTGGTVASTGGSSSFGGSENKDNPKLRKAILGRWQNKSGKLQLEFRDAPTGIEAIILRVPDVWPKNRVKIGDVVFVKGKIVGDVIEGLYVNLPQNTDCPNLETRYSRCLIALDSNDVLRVSNSAFKYSFPKCTWSAVTYDDTWQWFRF